MKFILLVMLALAWSGLAACILFACFYFISWIVNKHNTSNTATKLDVTPLADVARRTSEVQGRSVSDVVSDMAKLAELNVTDMPELAAVQSSIRNLREIWVFAETPADLEIGFYTSVLKNICERHVIYTYFLPDEEWFIRLRNRLDHDIGNVDHVRTHARAIIAPPIWFLTHPGFALWITTDGVRGNIVRQISKSGEVLESQDLTRNIAETYFKKLAPYVRRVTGDVLRLDSGLPDDDSAPPQFDGTAGRLRLVR